MGKMSYWKYWIIGGKEWIAALLANLGFTVLYFLVFAVIAWLTQNAAGTAVGMLLLLPAYVFLFIPLWGFIANKLWGHK